jgi:hypothetical protein
MPPAGAQPMPRSLGARLAADPLHCDPYVAGPGAAESQSALSPWCAARGGQHSRPHKLRGALGIADQTIQPRQAWVACALGNGGGPCSAACHARRAAVLSALARHTAAWGRWLLAARRLGSSITQLSRSPGARSLELQHRQPPIQTRPALARRPAASAEWLAPVPPCSGPHKCAGSRCRKRSGPALVARPCYASIFDRERMAHTRSSYPRDTNEQRTHTKHTRSPLCTRNLNQAALWCSLAARERTAAPRPPGSRPAANNTGSSRTATLKRKAAARPQLHSLPSPPARGAASSGRRPRLKRGAPPGPCRPSRPRRPLPGHLL